MQKQSPTPHPSSFPASETPAKLGFHMPAEWEKHAATWLSWPTNTVTWPGKYLQRTEEIFLEMIEALLPGEKVHLLVDGPRDEEKVIQLLKRRSVDIKDLLLHQIPTVDSWIRDYGPTFVTKPGSKAWNKWIFNAWGGKYTDLAEDTTAFEKAPGLIPHPRFKADIVLEGGSIEVNGDGVCLTTEQCLLNKNRNPNLSRSQIERGLSDYLGVRQILWLGDGIEGDDTDGHVDDITRFASPNTILSVFEENEKDPNYAALKANWERLEGSVNVYGKKWDLVKLPMPGWIGDDEGRLPASYANFYIANGVVLLPVYSYKNDQRAIAILKEHFPTRRIVPIECTALVLGFGSIHCVTQQEPAV